MRRGSARLLLLPQAKSGGESHHQQGQVAMHDHGGLAAFGKLQQMPGIRAFFENAILNDATPVVGIEHLERIAYARIGYIDCASGFGQPILPCAHHHGIDGLTDVISAVGILRLSRIALLIVAGQPLDADHFRAQALLGGGFAMPVPHDSLPYRCSLSFGQSLRI